MYVSLSLSNEFFCKNWFAAGQCVNFVAGHIAKVNLQRVYVWICKRYFTKGLFAAGHITTVNLQRDILQKWIFMQSFCDSEFAAGISLNLRRVFVRFRRGPFRKIDFAAGDITKLNLQRVIWQKHICSRSMSEFAAGHFAKADLQRDRKSVG